MSYPHKHAVRLRRIARHHRKSVAVTTVLCLILSLVVSILPPPLLSQFVPSSWESVADSVASVFGLIPLWPRPREQDQAVWIPIYNFG